MNTETQPPLNPMTFSEMLEWIEALRSDQYMQAHGVLSNCATGGFCCLGVEQHIHKEACEPVTFFSSLRRSQMDALDQSVRLPAPWQNILMSLNDNGRSFHDIAMVIEANFLPHLAMLEGRLGHAGFAAGKWEYNNQRS